MSYKFNSKVKSFKLGQTQHGLPFFFLIILTLEQNKDQIYVIHMNWRVKTLLPGEDKFSYGYEGTGKKASGNEFVAYGKPFAKGDVVGCYADFETDGKVTLTYTVNGETQGDAFVLTKEELGDRALIPHVLCKNCTFTVNLGQEEHWSSSVLDG